MLERSGPDSGPKSAAAKVAISLTSEQADVSQMSADSVNDTAVLQQFCSFIDPAAASVAQGLNVAVFWRRDRVQKMFRARRLLFLHR